MTDDTRSPDTTDATARDYGNLVAAVSETLDLAGGLAAALDMANYTAFGAQARQVLDIATGLQAAIDTVRSNSERAPMRSRSAAMRLIDSFLSAPPEMANWQVAELAHRKGILATWLSQIEMSGGTLDTAPAEYLSRAWRRVQVLHSLGADLAEKHDATLIKGPVIARHMPIGVLRQSGDVGLATRDEQTLWRVVFDIQQRCDAIVRGFSLLRGGGSDQQIGVWLKWPAEEPLLDKPMGAMVSTCAFTGDLKQVGVRNAEIEDPDLLSLFAVAEERFQREFRVGDLIDFAVLVPALVATYGDGLVDAVTGWAAKL